MEEKKLTKIIKKEEALKIIKENDLSIYESFKNYHYCGKEFLDLEFIEEQFSSSYFRYAELNLNFKPLFKKTIQIKKGFFGDKKVEIKENTRYYLVYNYKLNVFFLIEKDFKKEEEQQRLSIINKYF